MAVRDLIFCLCLISTCTIKSVTCGCEKEAPNGCGADAYCQKLFDTCTPCTDIETYCEDKKVLERIPECSLFCARTVANRRYEELEKRYNDVLHQKEGLETRLNETSLHTGNTFKIDWLHITLLVVIGVVLLSHLLRAKAVANWWKRILQARRGSPYGAGSGSETTPLTDIITGELTSDVHLSSPDKQEPATPSDTEAPSESTDSSGVANLQCDEGFSTSRCNREPSGHSGDGGKREQQKTTLPSGLSESQDRPEPSAPPLNENDSGVDTTIASSSTSDTTGSDPSTPQQSISSATPTPLSTPGSTPPPTVRHDHSFPSSIINQPTTEDSAKKRTYALPANITVSLHSDDGDCSSTSNQE